MTLFEPGVVLRIPLYIITGITCEFFFTGLANLVYPSFLKSWNVFGREFSAMPPAWYDTRDGRAVGYSFLWMIPIYSLLILMEPLFQWLNPLHWSMRGVIYALMLWAVEYSTGWFIEKIIGRCPWDYRFSRTNIHGYIRLDFFLFWVGFMLLAEWLSGKFILLTPALKELF